MQNLIPCSRRPRFHRLRKLAAILDAFAFVPNKTARCAVGVLVVCPLFISTSFAQEEPTLFEQGLQARVQQATVAVLVAVSLDANTAVPYRGGTGFVAGLHKNGFFVVTADHVLDGLHIVGVQFFDTDLSGRITQTIFDVTVLARWAKKDIALLRVNADHWPTVLPVSAVPPDVGDPVMALGCGDCKPPYSVFGVVRYRKNSDGFCESSCPIIGGFSGSPLVNTNGQLVGMNVRGNDRDICSSVRLDIIKEFLADNKCQFLHEPTPEANDRRALHMPLLVFKIILIKLAFAACSSLLRGKSK